MTAKKNMLNVGPIRHSLDTDMVPFTQADTGEVVFRGRVRYFMTTSFIAAAAIFIVCSWEMMA